MKEQIATIEIKDPYWNNELIKAIEKAGYTMVLISEGICSSNYSIAKDIKEKE